MLLKCKTVYKKSVVRTLMAKKLGEKLRDGGEGAGGWERSAGHFLSVAHQ